MNNRLNQDIFFDILQKNHQIFQDSPFQSFSLNLRSQENKNQYSFQNLILSKQFNDKNQDISQYINSSKQSDKNQQDQNYDSADSEQKIILPRQQQKKRNRQSAKNCRKKKKQYIQKLQEQCIENRKKISRLSLRLKELQDQLNQIKYSNTIEKQTFNQINKVCIKKLSQLLNDSQKHQIQNYVMEMKSRFGPAGKDRTSLLNYYMSQFMQNMLADFQKYFISSILKKRGLWGPQQDKFDIQIRQLLSMPLQKKNFLIKKYFSQIHREAVLYHQICQKIYENYTSLAIQAKNFQDTIMNMKEQLGAANMGKVVIFFQQNKHRLQIRKIKQQWIQSFNMNTHSSQIDIQLKKKCKRNFDQIELLHQK